MDIIFTKYTLNNKDNNQSLVLEKEIVTTRQNRNYTVQPILTGILRLTKRKIQKKLNMALGFAAMLLY